MGGRHALQEVGRRCLAKMLHQNDVHLLVFLVVRDKWPYGQVFSQTSCNHICHLVQQGAYQQK
jgi:hypothetical protein